LFAAEYVKDMNGTQAAIRAGYSKKTANEQAARLLAKASVGAEVARLSRAQLEECNVTALDVKRRLALLGFQDIRTLFDQAGNLRPLHELTADEAAVIAGMEIIIKNAQAGDGVTDRVHKVRLVDQVKPLEMLAKHFGLLEDHGPMQLDVTYRWATK
jgi:phage terminase small subunit